MTDIQGLRLAVQELAAEQRRVLTEHPMPDELVDYQAGDLTLEEQERIQDHLAVCPACAQALLDVEALPQVELSEQAVGAAWQRFQARSGAGRGLSLARTVWPWSLAAALLVAVLGLSVEVARLQREVGRSAGPQAGAQLVELMPIGEDVQRSAGESTVQAPDWVERWILVLYLRDEPVLPAYEPRITAADGHEVWRGAEMRPSSDGTLLLEVPRRFLPAGEYRIGLYGTGEHGRSLVAEYSLRLQA
jgi:hypothetical protein